MAYINGKQVIFFGKVNGAKFLTADAYAYILEETEETEEEG